MLVEDEAKVARRVGCVERRVMDFFASCLVSPMSRNSVLDELIVESLTVNLLRSQDVPDRFSPKFQGW